MKSSLKSCSIKQKWVTRKLSKGNNIVMWNIHIRSIIEGSQKFRFKFYELKYTKLKFESSNLN